MGHASNILQAMRNYPCDVCGKPIGKDSMGSRVHLECMDLPQAEEKQDEARS